MSLSNDTASDALDWILKGVDSAWRKQRPPANWTRPLPPTNRLWQRQRRFQTKPPSQPLFRQRDMTCCAPKSHTGRQWMAW